MAANAQDEDHPESNSQFCDHCNEKKALLYCRADSAKLCISCDRQVHSANAIFSKHFRAHLCNICRDQPASILCASHQQLLCSNCDFDAHLPSLEAHQHNRRPLEPFSGCPSATELSSLFGFDDDKSLWLRSDDNSGGSDEGLWSELVWEAPSVLSMQDLIVPVEARDGSGCGWDFQAFSVPPPPKHRNVACGRNKEEIIEQLRDLFKSESVLNNDYFEFESSRVLHFLQPEGPDQNDFFQNISSINVEPDSASVVTPGSKENSLKWNGGGCEVTNKKKVASSGEHLSGTSTSQVIDGQNGRVSEINSSVEKGILQQPVIREITSLPPKSVYELLAQDRDLVISRYKEKKKTRRYDKQIRYESRKTRADSRARVRGRFAKAVQEDQGEGTSLNRR
ncbi:zinc finger protein CONSTANS-LIKE 13-like isoform X2 [Aristolochia californica]|uniref:zinc finger protein CONSTANS-LIKE 13-like isoform X2 n=1 Tax=Aristolochia californica TaxID=171875 RepID=UPI0035D614FC